jgi:hypothetical protein
MKEYLKSHGAKESCQKVNMLFDKLREQEAARNCSVFENILHHRTFSCCDKMCVGSCIFGLLNHISDPYRMEQRCKENSLVSLICLQDADEEEEDYNAAVLHLSCY